MVKLSMMNFIREDNPHVKRIHFTHTDLDGVSCAVMEKLIESAVKNQKTSSEDSPITTIYVDKLSTIHEQINQTINTVLNQGFDRTIDKLHLLITDIGNVVPSKMLQIFDENGIGNCAQFCVVDHHIISDRDVLRNIALRECNDPECILDRTMIVETILDKNSPNQYYYSKYYSATAMMEEIFDNWLHVVPSNWKRGIQKSFVEVINMYAITVSEYDTGNWGSWNFDKFDVVHHTVKAQLLYSYLMSKYDNNYDDVVSYLIDRIKVYLEKYHDLYSNQKYMINAMIIDCKPGVEETWREIIAYYNKFVRGLKTLNDVTVPICYDQYLDTKFNINVRLPFKIQYYVIKNKDDNIKHFSIISREYFDESGFTGALMLINTLYNTVELRSNSSNGVNVFEIAKLNGGGGHPHAAGFPYTAITVK